MQNTQEIQNIAGSIFSIDMDYLVIGMIVLAVLTLTVVILLIVQICKVSKLKHRLNRLTLGKDAESLENEIATLFEDVNILKNNTERNKKDIRNLYKKSEITFRKMGLIKYDAFNQMGGQLSFCLALLNENNNGFIINSVHSTEGCYSYAKEIRNGVCSLALGKEEEEALAIAMGE